MITMFIFVESLYFAMSLQNNIFCKKTILLFGSLRFYGPMLHVKYYWSRSVFFALPVYAKNLLSR